MSAISTTINPNDFAYDYVPRKKKQEKKIVKHACNYASAKKASKPEAPHKPKAEGTVFVPKTVDENIPVEKVETVTAPVPEPEKEFAPAIVEKVGAPDVVIEAIAEDNKDTEDAKAVEVPVAKEEETLANTESDSVFGESMSVEPEETTPKRKRSTRVRSRLKIS